MSKPQLINQLKKSNPSLNKAQINNIIEIFVESLIKSIVNRKIVEIRHFGRFYFKALKENFNARNPNTNQLIYKPKRIKLRFKPSNTLKRLINQ